VALLLDAAASRLATRGPRFAAALKLRQQTSAIFPGSQPIAAQLHSADEDPQAKRRKETLRQRLLERHAEGDAILGRLVFRSQVCHHCHQPRGGGEFAGPPLEGVATANPVEYLVDSILYPSRAIKTGFMLEQIVTHEGRMFVGGVARQGDQLIITSPSGTTDRIQLADVDQRRRMNQSLMPESLEMTMSEPELLDLVAYLTTLREPPKSISIGEPASVN
jgi:putative heme-binding domain-containing protein